MKRVEGLGNSSNKDPAGRSDVDRARHSSFDKTIALHFMQSHQLRPEIIVTAIVNLLLNAADALAGKGAITVRTGPSDGGGWIEVADNGPGIPPEIRNRILEPFFTTKGAVGTGLGLAIVYAFSERHGGRLDIESEPGKGARFRMWFPVSEKTVG